MELSKSEQEVISLARQFEGLRMNPAWQKLREAVNAFRDEALEAVHQCRSSNAQVRSNLLTRYEERKRVGDFMDSYLEAISNKRKELIRDLAEANGHYGEEAENILDSLSLTQQ